MPTSEAPSNERERTLLLFLLAALFLCAIGILLGSGHVFGGYTDYAVTALSSLFGVVIGLAVIVIAFE
jgi:hypothetical protein